MSNEHPGKISLVLALTLVFSSLFLASCSNSLPKVVNVASSLVYDYSEYDAAPDVYLSVFGCTECNAARIKNVHFESNSSGLSWECDSPEFFTGKGNKEWAGYSRFVPVQNMPFPSGRYSFFIEDKAGNVEESAFFVNPVDSLADATAEMFPEVLKLPNIVKIALYNSEDVIIYYGDMQKEWKEDTSEIPKSVPGTVKYRKIYYVNNGNILCLMPFEVLD